MQQQEAKISIEECRRHLGEDGKDMSDEQIRVLRDALYPAIESVLDQHFMIYNKNTNHG